jgi:hypothetical protein
MMLFSTCPVCERKTIFFPTRMLHVWGGWQHSRSNRFECTHCHALLGTAYSPVPFLLLGALVKLFLTQSGALKDLWIGGVLCALMALPLFPIRQWPEAEAQSMFAAVRTFRDPWDQGFYCVESRLLSLLVAVLAAAAGFVVVGRVIPGAQAHAGGLVFMLLVGIVAVAAAMAFASLIYRIGRASTVLRMAADVVVVAGMVYWVWLG